MLAKRIRPMARDIRRMLGLSPLQRVFKRLRENGIELEKMRALEVFGGDGMHHTKEIHDAVASLDIWEIRPACESTLRRNFPAAEIKITDSYAELRRTQKKFDLVVVDNASEFGEHCEHFDMFPDLFRVLANEAVLILNVTPSTPSESKQRLARRQEFYGAVDPKNISLDEMARTYEQMASSNGWKVEHLLFEKRPTYSQQTELVYYGALALRRYRS